MKILTSIIIIATLLHTPASAAWKYRTETDKMRGAKISYAEARSKNRAQLSFPYQGGSFVEITFRDSPKHGKDVFLWINRGQMPCIMGCNFNVRFDKEDVEAWSGSGSSDGSSDTIFISNYEEFTVKAKKSTTITIEVELYNEGTRQFVFDVKGLKWDQ